MYNLSEKDFLDFRHLDKEELENLIYELSEVCELLIHEEINTIIKVGRYEQPSMQ